MNRVAGLWWWSTGLAALVIVPYAGCIGLLYALQRTMLFPVAAMPPLAPYLLPGWSEISIRTKDGETLRALWHAPHPGCGLVLSFHGNASYPEGAMERFGNGVWVADGWGTLAIAYRGYPGSTGHPSGSGLRLDAQAAYDEARRRAPDAPILVHSHSLGGWPALTIASQPSNEAIKGLFMEAPFSSAVRVASDRYPWAPVGLLMRDPMRSDRLMARVTVPVVIVHGIEDGVVPVAEGKRLAAFGHDVNLDLIHANHGSVFGREDTRWEPWFTARIAPRCATAVN